MQIAPMNSGFDNESQNRENNKNSENKLGEYKMGSQKEVNIEPIKGTLNDYVIKDKDKIVVAREFVLIMRQVLLLYAEFKVFRQR